MGERDCDFMRGTVELKIRIDAPTFPSRSG